MKSTLCVVLALVCCVFLVAAPAQTEKRASAVDVLLRQKRDVLQQILDIVRIQHEDERLPADAVLQARIKVLEVDIQLAKSREARIHFHEERVKNFKELHDVARQGHATGTVTMKEMLLTKAELHQAEIDLARERNSN